MASMKELRKSARFAGNEAGRNRFGVRTLGSTRTVLSAGAYVASGRRCALTPATKVARNPVPVVRPCPSATGRLALLTTVSVDAGHPLAHPREPRGDFVRLGLPDGLRLRRPPARATVECGSGRTRWRGHLRRDEPYIVWSARMDASDLWSDGRRSPVGQTRVPAMCTGAGHSLQPDTPTRGDDMPRASEAVRVEWPLGLGLPTEGVAAGLSTFSTSGIACSRCDAETHQVIPALTTTHRAPVLHRRHATFNRRESRRPASPQWESNVPIGRRCLLEPWTLARIQRAPTSTRSTPTAVRRRRRVDAQSNRVALASLSNRARPGDHRRRNAHLPHGSGGRASWESRPV